MTIARFRPLAALKGPYLLSVLARSAVTQAAVLVAHRTRAVSAVLGQKGIG
ncbi:MAG: hypothetical protein R3B70_03665 [Polyangiaceae bacterium]